MVGLGGDHAVDGGRSLDLGRFYSKLFANQFIPFRIKRNRIFCYFIQSITFEIMQILLEISYGNLVYLGINLLGSVDAFDLKNNIFTLEFQFFGLLVSDVVIGRTVVFDDTNGLATFGLDKHGLEDDLGVAGGTFGGGHAGLGGLLWTKKEVMVIDFGTLLANSNVSLTIRSFVLVGSKRMFYTIYFTSLLI